MVAPGLVQGKDHGILPFHRKFKVIGVQLATLDMNPGIGDFLRISNEGGDVMSPLDGLYNNLLAE